MKLQPQFLNFKNASHSLRVIFSATEIEVIVRNHIKYNEKTRNKINMSGNMKKKTFLIPAAIFFRENWSHALFMILSVLLCFFPVWNVHKCSLIKQTLGTKILWNFISFPRKKSYSEHGMVFFGCSYLHN